MKLIAAVKATKHTLRRQFPQALLATLFQLVLRMMVFAPLLFLTAKETSALALLCIPLYILIVFPARQNMACCMQDALEGGSLFSLRLISFEGYGRKVWRGVKQTLLLMAWGSLFIACTGLAVFIYAGKTIEGVTDVFTLIKTMMALGGGSTIKGATVVICIYAATVLPLLLGVAFHSGTRHAVALGGRKLLKGHRFGVIMAWLAGACALLPFLAVAVWIGAGYVSGLISAVANLGSGSITLPPLKENLMALGAAAVLLLFPAIPVKQLLSAAYVRELTK
ncbi:MAG: hypothetical protein IJ507_02820 [Clostridia bacterium]|nr:hypothetical protein [Clostridia bacterium]